MVITNFRLFYLNQVADVSNINKTLQSMRARECCPRETVGSFYVICNYSLDLTNESKDMYGEGTWGKSTCKTIGVKESEAEEEKKMVWLGGICWEKIFYSPLLESGIKISGPYTALH